MILFSNLFQPLSLLLIVHLISGQAVEKEDESMINDDESNNFDSYREVTPTPSDNSTINPNGSESRRAQSMKKSGFYGEVIIRGEGGIRGYIFMQSSWNGVAIYGLVCGLRPGNHGWHIHQYGQYNGRCDNAGPHFALIRYPHAGPTDRFRHNGDLGNLQADQRGIAYVNQFNGQVTIIPESNSSIIGRAILIHEWPDDYGVGKGSESMTTGNTGKVIACGLIALRRDKAPFPTGCPPPTI